METAKFYLTWFHFWSTECPAGLFLFQESCLTVCPESFHGTFKERINRKGVTIKSASGTCHPCHYSCRTCAGSLAENCISCFDDSTLVSQMSSSGIRSTTCYPSHVLNAIENNAVWYKVFVVIIFFNILLVVFLIGCTCLRKCREIELGRNWLEKKGEYRRVAPDDSQLEQDTDVRYSIPRSGID